MDNRDNGRSMPRQVRPRHPDGTFDETEWVDWDHWQAVEEIQNFLDGLSDMTDTDLVGGNESGGRIVRQIRRHGLGVTD